MAVTFAQIVLQRGSHICPGDGLSIAEAAALWAGEPHTSQPECVCAALTRFVTVLNDAMPDALRTPILLPLLPLLTRTRSADAREAQRQAADRTIFLLLWAVKDLLPVMLRRASFYARAEACSRITSVAEATGAIQAAIYAIGPYDPPEALRDLLTILSYAAEAMSSGDTKYVPAACGQAVVSAAAFAVVAFDRIRSRPAPPWGHDAVRYPAPEDIWAMSIAAVRSAAALGDPYHG